MPNTPRFQASYARPLLDNTTNNNNNVEIDAAVNNNHTTENNNTTDNNNAGINAAGINNNSAYNNNIRRANIPRLIPIPSTPRRQNGYALNPEWNDSIPSNSNAFNQANQESSDGSDLSSEMHAAQIKINTNALAEIERLRTGNADPLIQNERHIKEKHILQAQYAKTFEQLDYLRKKMNPAKGKEIADDEAQHSA